jgi:hypothetical protein
MRDNSLDSARLGRFSGKRGGPGWCEDKQQLKGSSMIHRFAWRRVFHPGDLCQ